MSNWLKQKFITLQFWRLEVQNQDVERVCFFLRAVRKNLFHISFLVAGGLLAISGIAQLVETTP